MTPTFKYIPIVPFIEKFYILGDGSRPHLEEFQKQLLEKAFTPDANGILPYKQVVLSMPKKSGKTALGAMIATWFAFSGIGESRGEIILAANDEEQAAGRVYKAMRDCIEQSEFLRNQCVKIYDKGIELKNGTTISAISGDYAGAAGSNPELSVFDELWAFMKPGSRRLFDELTPSPARRNSIRLIVTYAGIVGESLLLEDIYRSNVKEDYRLKEFVDLPVYENKTAHSLTYWDHVGRMPWQTPQYLESQRNQPGYSLPTYLRHHENRWVDSQSGIDMNEWDSCVEFARSMDYMTWPGPSRNLNLALGIDASTKKDRAAVVTCFKRDGMIWLGPHKFWQPSKEDPLKFEQTIERFVLNLQAQYSISIAYYDPWQFERSAQLLKSRGVPCWEYSQTIPNTIKSTEYTLDLLRERRLVLYPDSDLRDEAKSVEIKEIPGRGRRFMKTNENKKIDSIVALSMAALACGEHCPDIEELRGQFMLLRGRHMSSVAV